MFCYTLKQSRTNDENSFDLVSSFQRATSFLLIFQFIRVVVNLFFQNVVDIWVGCDVDRHDIIEFEWFERIEQLKKQSEKTATRKTRWKKSDWKIAMKKTRIHVKQTGVQSYEHVTREFFDVVITMLALQYYQSQ